MSKPPISISAPANRMDELRRSLPRFREEVGLLSPVVVKMVIDGIVLGGDELQLYTARERLKNKEKRYLIIELD